MQMDTTRETAVSKKGMMCAEEPAAAVLQLKLLEFIEHIAVMVIASLLNVPLLYLSGGHLSTR